MAELGAEDWLALRSLPTDTLDSLRSKLVQLVDAVQVRILFLSNTLALTRPTEQSFRAQLATTPIHSLTLTYPALLSKLLILLNHTQALHHALATPQIPTSAPDPFEIPSARAAREEDDRWKFAGGAKASRIGNVGVVVRGGEKGRKVGLDGSEAEQTAVQDLFITNQVRPLLLSPISPSPMRADGVARGIRAAITVQPPFARGSDAGQPVDRGEVAHRRARRPRLALPVRAAADPLKGRGRRRGVGLEGPHRR